MPPDARNPPRGTSRPPAAKLCAPPRIGIATAKSTISSLAVVKLVVGLETAHRQHVFQHGAQLRLTPAAARLDVAEQALDVADLRRHRLDIAQRLLHRRELIDDAREALLHLLFDRRMELLIHHRLHLGQPLLVALTQVSVSCFSALSRSVVSCRSSVAPMRRCSSTADRPAERPSTCRDGRSLRP